jgi:predicted nucleic acid-binding protein
MGTHLLDTNVVIDFLANKLPPNGMRYMATVVNNVPILSIISKIELLGFNGTTAAMELTEEFVNISTLLSVSPEVVDKTIELRRQYKIKLPDAIIAATALVHNLTLISRNFDDFKRLAGLTVVDAHRI